MAERKSKTLFVRNLPYSTTNEKLAEVFEQVGPIKKSFVVADKESGKCKGYGYVQFSMLEDAAKALETVTHCEGRRISLSFADAKKKQKKPKKNTVLGEEEVEEKEADTPAEEEKEKKEKPPRSTPKLPKQKPVKRCRLIVRNLAFKCKEADLRTEFEKFGDISEIVIPLKKGTLSRGFAFIQFTQLNSAQRAVAKMNAKEIMGRPVAVDWAVAKDRFEASNPHDSDKDSGVSEDEEEEKSDMEEQEKEDDEDDEESDSEEEDVGSESSDDEEKDEDDDSADEDDSDADSTEEDSAGKPEKKPAIQRKSDVEEGRTLFVRNIPFEAEEEDVEEVFQEFGDTAYVRLVMDKVTGRPRGTAFVQFKTKESADQCLERVQDSSRDGGISIQGRRLLVVLAVSRTEAQNQQSAKKNKEEKDNRNLFLAREGLIRAGTQAAIGISQDDMKRRMKIEQMKREKLKNLNIFVSSTRLCVHNLPTKVNEMELKKVLRQTVEDPAMKITECRVMRDMDRSNQQGVSKSLGYAFVNFTQHEHALKALRALNNSTVFGENKRPIVEFSLENKKALEAKEKRLEKSKLQAQKRKTEDGRGEKSEGSPAKKRPMPAKGKSDKTQDRIAKSMHTGPKGMPKRMGPKIRHRNRGKGANPTMNRKTKKGKKFQPTKQQAKPNNKMPKKKKKKGEMTDSVDRLIHKHKAKKARMFNTS